MQVVMPAVLFAACQGVLSARAFESTASNEQDATSSAQACAEQPDIYTVPDNLFVRLLTCVTHCIPVCFSRCIFEFAEDPAATLPAVINKVAVLELQETAG